MEPENKKISPILKAIEHTLLGKYLVTKKTQYLIAFWFSFCCWGCMFSVGLYTALYDNALSTNSLVILCIGFLSNGFSAFWLGNLKPASISFILGSAIGLFVYFYL